MDPLRRSWLLFAPLIGLLPLLLFRKAVHPAFQMIRMFSWPLAGLAMLSFMGALLSQSRMSPAQWWEQFSRSRSVFRILPPTLFIVALVLFSLVRSGVISSSPEDSRIYHLLTGDEPSYLLMTHSLVFDGDLDLSNNREDTRHFYRHPLLGKGQFGFDFYNRIAQGRLTGKEKAWGDRQYFINRPGLPVLLAPAYWIGFQAEKRIRFSVLVWMNILAASLILALFYLAKAYSGSPSAVIPAFYLALSPPIIYYSNQIYPDLPAALCLTGALIGLIKARGRWTVLVTGLAVAFLPWFHERFFGLLAVLLITAFFRPEVRRRWPYFLFLPILSLILQGGYYYFFYGLPFPLNSHKPLSLRAAPRGLLALLTDRDKGLLFLNPLLAFSFIGLFPLWRQNRWLTLTLATLLLVYLIPVASFPDWHGGICPPLRYLVVVAPLSVIPMLALFKSASWRFSRAGLLALGAWGVWMGSVLAVQPKLWFWEYGPAFQNRDYRTAHALAPGYFHPEAHSRVLSLFWISLLAMFPFLDRLWQRPHKNGPWAGAVFSFIPLILSIGLLAVSIGSWLIKK